MRHNYPIARALSGVRLRAIDHLLVQSFKSNNLSIVRRVIIQGNHPLSAMPHPLPPKTW